MKILFTVQGEGRGHMTQALACHEMLSRSGHELVGVVAGKISARSLPEFFATGFPVPVETLPSPGFIFRNNRSVDVPATVWQVARHPGRISSSLKSLRKRIDELKPDLVLNFLEPLTGMAQWIRPLPCPVLAVGHQYMIDHPTYVRLPGKRVQQFGMRRFVHLVGTRSHKLALSFYRADDLPELRLRVCPPILRNQLFDLKPFPGDYFLAYLLNHGYAEEILEWHRAHPTVKLHCFYNKPGSPERESVNANLVFHQLNGTRFLEMMAGCRAVVCTAGFESVSEAAWLGKPVFMVPVENHVEQMINALDAVRLGFGLTDQRFHLDRLQELPAKVDNAAFSNWVGSAETVLLRALHSACPAQPASRPFAEPSNRNGIAAMRTSR